MTEMNKTKTAANSSNDEIDLGRLLGALLDSYWLIIGITAFFAVAGIVYLLFATPEYQSDSLIQVEQNTGSSLLSNLSEIVPINQKGSSTEIELIRSRMVIGKTIDDLNLDTTVKEKYLPVFGMGWARITGQKNGVIALSRLTVPDDLLEQPLELKITGKDSYQLLYDSKVLIEGKIGVFIEKDGVALLVSDIAADVGTTFEVIKRARLVTLNEILASLTVEDKGKDTGVLSLSYVGDDPILVQKVLDSISKNYLQQNVERKSEEAARSLAFLKEQLPSVRNSLNHAEDLLNQFRQKNDSVDLSLEAKSVLDSIVAVESQLNELTFKEAEISKLYTKEHPAYKALLEKRTTLEKESLRLNKRVSSMPKTQQEILRLARDVDAGKEIYMQLLNKQQELSIAKASTVGNVRIVDFAVTQPKPVKPKKVITIFLSIFMGCVVSVSIVLLKVVLHKGIETPDQLEQEGINVYASIPLSEWQQKKDRESLIAKKKSNNRSLSLLAVGNPTDLAIEAIRSLRTSLHFAMLEAKNNVLMISGASPNIGKTFVSINLAAVIAQSGFRVLTIDADMRKGYSHTLLGVSWENGLSDLLSKQATIQDVVKKTGIEGMDFISRGQTPPNPSELLMRSQLNDLIQWASENYDIVLIDTPPILAVTDAAIIGNHVGTSLIVARFAMNTVKEIDVSIRRFEQNGVNIKGVILNSVIRRASGYNGNYGYYQYEYKSGDNS